MGNAMGNKQKPATVVKAGPLSKGRHFQPAKRVGGRATSTLETNFEQTKNGIDYNIRNDGTIMIRSNGLSADRFYLEHHDTFIKERHLLVRHYELVGTFIRNKHGLIGLPHYFEHDKFAFHYTGSISQNYIAPEALAALLGALKKAGFCDISLNHWSMEDGKSPEPSVSHIDGKNGDIRPLSLDHSGGVVNLLENPEAYDKERSQKLVDALGTFGWKSILFYKHPKTGYLPNGTKHHKNHQHHFHIQKFTPKIVRYK